MMGDYFHAVFAYYWVLITGGAVAFVDFITWHGRSGRELKFPVRVRIGIAMAALIIAQGLAYRDAKNSLANVIEEKRQAYIDKNKAQAKADTLQDELNQAYSRPPVVVSSAAPSTVEEVTICDSGSHPDPQHSGYYETNFYLSTKSQLRDASYKFDFGGPTTSMNVGSPNAIFSPVAGEESDNIKGVLSFVVPIWRPFTKLAVSVMTPKPLGKPKISSGLGERLVLKAGGCK